MKNKLIFLLNFIYILKINIYVLFNIYYNYIFNKTIDDGYIQKHSALIVRITLEYDNIDFCLIIKEKVINIEILGYLYKIKFFYISVR